MCEGQILKGEPFSLQDRYVVHRLCAGQPPKVELTLADVRRRVAALDAAIQRERMDRDNALSTIKAELQTARLEAIVLRGDADRLRTSRDEWRERAEARGGYTTELEAQLTAMRNQMPVARPPQPAPGSAPVQPTEEQPVADDTATRFSLLELD